jgi:hypothetical protein
MGGGLGGGGCGAADGGKGGFKGGVGGDGGGGSGALPGAKGGGETGGGLEGPHDKAQCRVAYPSANFESTQPLASGWGWQISAPSAPPMVRMR